jgi:isoquinoline 1-oxidoreductase subunit beta
MSLRDLSSNFEGRQTGYRGHLNRRRFLKLSGAGLVFAVSLPFLEGCTRDGEMAVRAWLKLQPNGTLNLLIPRAEIGQGISTALSMLMVEEMDASWERLSVELAPAGEQFGVQRVAESHSIVDFWLPLREAGAAARLMLLQAAAMRWGVSVEACRTANHQVLGPESDMVLDYGALATAASRLPVPENVELKSPERFQLIGTDVPRLNELQMLTGEARYGIDQRMPGLLFASIERSPTFGGTVESWNDEAALNTSGVVSVLPTTRLIGRHTKGIYDGVAVVARSTWAALVGRRKMKVEWNAGPGAGFDSATYREELIQRAELEGEVVTTHQYPPTETVKGPKLSLNFDFPFLAHSCLEPMNCTAVVKGGQCQVWAPTQDPRWARRAASDALGMPKESIQVYPILAGGGFGRRMYPDYVSEAVQVAQKLKAPVQVVWTREDDLKNDFYRVASHHRLVAQLSASGTIHSWLHHVVAPIHNQGIAGPANPEFGRGMAVQGAVNLPYRIPHFQVQFSQVDAPLGTGIWRGVNNNQNIFVNECTMDVLAKSAEVDPLEFRMRHLDGQTRLKNVLEVVAQKAGWQRFPRRMGLACAFYVRAGSYVAQIAVLDESNRLEKMICVADCGTVVNPNHLKAQLEGAIIDGLTSFFRREIEVRDGRVTASNFDDYPMMRIDEVPRIETYLIESTEPPGGGGELGILPAAPAVANALFAATGQRIESLPWRGQS